MKAEKGLENYCFSCEMFKALYCVGNVRNTFPSRPMFTDIYQKQWHLVLLFLLERHNHVTQLTFACQAVNICRVESLFRLCYWDVCLYILESIPSRGKGNTNLMCFVVW